MHVDVHGIAVHSMIIVMYKPRAYPVYPCHCRVRMLFWSVAWQVPLGILEGSWELLGAEQALREIYFGGHFGRLTVFQLGKSGARVWRREARDLLLGLGMAGFPWGG